MKHYTALEQHKDGAWWYHPGWSFDNFDQAADLAVDFSHRYDGRPVTVIEHTGDFPAAQSCCTRELVTGPVTFIGITYEPLAEITITQNLKK